MNILNLPEFKVLKEETNEHDYLFTVETIDEPVVCMNCNTIRDFGTTGLFKKHSKNERLVSDISMHGKRVKIKIIHKRYKCPNCNYTFYELLDSVDTNDKVTRRLRSHIQKEALKKQFTTIAEEFGISNMTVRRAFDDFVKENDKNRVLKAPRVIGIDEAHLNKTMRGVITDIENKRILELTENNLKKTIKATIQSMEGYKDIQYATMDMATGYRYAMNELVPDAICIIDKFHVIQYANRALDAVRIAFKNSITKEQKKLLRNDRWLLLSNKEDLTAKDIDRRDNIFRMYPVLEMAYMQKEALRDIYKIPDRKTAYECYYAWERSIPDILPQFKALAETINTCKTEIFNYFLTDIKYTNAYTESINNIIKRIEKSGVGYSFEVLRAKVLYGTAATKKPKWGESHFYTLNKLIWSPRIESTYTNTPTKEGQYVDITTLLKIMDEGNF